MVLMKDKILSDIRQLSMAPLFFYEINTRNKRLTEQTLSLLKHLFITLNMTHRSVGSVREDLVIPDAFVRLLHHP